MKEATGELNMTVITVVAIAAVGLLFTVFVWPNIQSNLALSTACSQVDNNGNYTSTEAGMNAGDEGFISCASYVCTAHYNNKDYQRDCRN